MVREDLMRETKEKCLNYSRLFRSYFRRHKSYIESRIKDIKFEIGDKVFLKFLPWETQSEVY